LRKNCIEWFAPSTLRYREWAVAWAGQGQDELAVLLIDPFGLRGHHRASIISQSHSHPGFPHVSLRRIISLIHFPNPIRPFSRSFLHRFDFAD
jgi:hypothetical protein